MELYKYITGVLLLLIVASLNQKDGKRIIICIILTGFFISLIAMYQYFFGFKRLLGYIAKEEITNPFVLDYVSRKRVFSPFVTPNILGGYLAMIIPLTLLYRKSIWLAIPLVFALLLTKSIGAFISLFLGLLIYFYLSRKLGKRRIIFLFGLFLMIILVVITRLSTQKLHIHPVFSTVMRLGYWKDTLEIIKQAPLTGIGLGNFNLLQSRYAHNSYLQIWAEMGVLGIISFLWLVIAVYKSALLNIRRVLKENNWGVYLVTAFSIFLIHNLIDFSFFLPEVALIWWVILALII
jgi:putative inorganic carbon (HCO3(-)) transporter